MIERNIYSIEKITLSYVSSCRITDRCVQFPTLEDKELRNYIYFLSVGEYLRITYYLVFDSLEILLKESHD